MANKKQAKSLIELQSLSEPRMLFSLSWPVVLSLLAQGLYNLVDSIFLSRLGEEVISAVSLSYVIQSIAISLFSGIAVGMNAIITKSIGASDECKKNRALTNGFIVMFILVLIFVAFGLFFIDLYFEKTTDNVNVIAYGIEYLRPQLILCIVMALQILFERLLQTTGLNKYLIYSQVIGSLINIILDPIMIFGLLGCKPMGVAGAAYASIIGQLSASIVAFALNMSKNRLLFDKYHFFENIHIKDIIEVFRIGIPSSAAGLTMSVGNYFINRILIGFSVSANATFGIYAKLQSFAHLPNQGINSGLITMTAFFYGKKDLKRVNKTLKAAAIFLEAWYVFVFILLFFFPITLLSIFEYNAEIERLAGSCFRIISLTYLVSGLVTGISSFFQAIGKPKFALYSYIVRQMFVRVPVAYYFASFGDVNLIWWSWVVSEILSDIVLVFIFVRVYKKFAAELSSSAA